MLWPNAPSGESAIAHFESAPAKSKVSMIIGGSAFCHLGRSKRNIRMM